MLKTKLSLRGRLFLSIFVSNNKSMNTVSKIIVLAALILGLYILVDIGVAPELLSVEKHLQQLKAEEGREYVIQGDTVLVLKYNLIGNSYNLSNGMEVGADFIRDFKRVPTNGTD